MPAAATAPVTLQPGVPVTLAPAAVAGISWASFANDNTVAGGLNSVAASVTVRLTWQATQDGSTWYEIASCSVKGGGSDPACSLGVSTMESEQQVRLQAVQPSAVAGAVVLSPTTSATAVGA